jgi:cell wall-associated NlpC family hydrolase
MTMSAMPVPAGIDAVQSTFSALANMPPSQTPFLPGAPLNPFSVLLAAASGPASSSATGDTATSAFSTGELAGLVTSSSSATVNGSAVVADAERYLGVPYQWGGTSPSSGFDCSGLVQYVYRDLGIALPRTSQQQALAGQAVAGLGAAEPGDLLFFEPGPEGPGHVAIYYGNDLMIAAPHTGEPVQLQQVPDGLVAIRRVIGNEQSAGLETSIGQSEIGNVAVPSSDAGLIASSASMTGVPASLLAAVLSTESNFDPNAVSPAGAEGIAQLMPTTAASLGADPLDPTSAIPAAARLLGQYFNNYGSWPEALVAYNAGPGAVAQGMTSDPAVENYVTTVLDRAGL